MLSRLTQVTSTISMEDWILNKLRFDEMHDRELSIEDAHAETFRWLLYDPLDKNLNKDSNDDQASKKDQEKEVTELEHGLVDLPNLELSPAESQPEDESDVQVFSEAPEDGTSPLEIKEQENDERKETRLRFLSWLNSGSGVFHISGKLGSGKSTLMKFLSKEARTKQELRKWASGKRLVFSQFFFWASGSDKQKSLEGLSRGILWDMLRECPDLMRHVFPRCWDADFSPVSDRLQDGPFTGSELAAAFKLLTSNTTVFDNHKVCFFIDGLDEFVGDHWKLARELKAWSDAGDLKICVSSRPHNEFIHTFADPNKHLRLHELTRKDIQKFVQDEFEHDERSLSVCAQDERYARLVDSLIEKAEGVFLWVRLATREILSGMGNNYSISQLEEELDQLPAGLEALFRKLLTSIRKPDRMRAARAFLIMMSELSFKDMNRLAVVHAVIDELSDADYNAVELYSAELGQLLTRDDVEKMTHTVQDRLNSRCKGLIQTSKREVSQIEEPAYLEFIHRSVYEFLAMRDVRTDLSLMAGPSFDPAKFMCMAYLRLLKGSYGLAEGSQSAEPEGVSPQFNQRKLDKQGSYFWLLEKLAMPILVITSETETKTSCPYLRELEVASKTLLKLSTCLPTTPTPRAPVAVINLGHVSCSLKFLSESNAVDAQRRAWLACCALFGARRFVLDRVSQLPDLLDPSARVDILLLASIGALNTVYTKDSAVKQALVTSLLERCVSPNWPLSNPFHFVLRLPSIPHLMNEHQTTWTMFLQHVTTFLPSANKMSKVDETDIACEIMWRYLKFGADPTVVFIGYQIVLPEKGPSGDSPDESSDILVGPTYFNLEQLVEMWDPPNKQDLLVLWNEKHQSCHTLWNMGLQFTRSFWQTKSVPRIPRIETESLQSLGFIVIAVVSANALPNVDASDVERWAYATERIKRVLRVGPYRPTWSIRI